MAIKLVRQEIYDNTGLVNVVFIEQEVLNTDQLISEKENELIRIYEEIQNLKNNQN
jgi:hypothetical protein